MMNPHYLLATMAPAAHGFAGEHMFMSTLLIDDPNTGTPIEDWFTT